MQSVFFAIAQIEVEQFIEKNLNKNEYKVVASATHRSVVLPLMRDAFNTYIWYELVHQIIRK